MDDDVDWALLDFDEPKKAGAVKAAPALKGVCPKCGKHIGRGLHFHVKACVGAQ
jgi:hypothetical protein